MRCDHSMLNVAAGISLAADLCGLFFSDAISEGVVKQALEPFLETWRKRSAYWTRLDYHWKIMCCGEAGGYGVLAGEVGLRNAL